jgi:lipopolysaccharide/colanic/teichoic acid biosynthesis glycosyltransferase
VLLDDMSLAKPSPNVKNEIDLYTNIERELLSVKSGITDFSSIVFADEGDISKEESNPDLAYNQLIRPWKSRLGIIYIENATIFLDIKIIFYTLVGIFFRKKALNWVLSELKLMNKNKEIIKIRKREESLYPFLPPGMDEIVKQR